MGCCNDNLLSGLNGCGCGCSDQADVWSLIPTGLGHLSGGLQGLQDVYPGDAYSFAVAIGGSNQGSTTLPGIIAAALEDNGLSYNTNAVYDTGYSTQWFVVSGNSNINATSPDDLVNQFVAAINYTLATYTGGGQVTRYAPKFVTTHNTEAGSTDNYVPTDNTNPGDLATVTGKQQACAERGLVYDAKSTKPGGCECGLIDGWLVSLGVKKTCTDEAFGFKSGAALAAVAIGAAILLPKILKNL